MDSKQEFEAWNEYIKKVALSVYGFTIDDNLGTNYSVDESSETIDIDYEEVKEDKPKQIE